MAHSRRATAPAEGGRGSAIRWQLRAAAPIVWRDDTTLQVGLGTRDAVVVAGADRAMARTLAALRRPCSLPELTDLGGAGSQEWLVPVLDQLQALGLVHRPRSGGTVDVLGGDRTAALITELLVGGSEHRVRLLWTGTTTPPRPVARLLAAHPHRLRVERRAVPDAAVLTVATFRAVEGDRALLRPLQEAGGAHLIVRACDATVAVGPLVLPGRTPCVQCEDLHRTRADPGWPRLLAQLCHRGGRADDVALHWAASTAVLQARALLEGGTPETLGAALELGPDCSIRLRRLRAHPGCACRSVRC